MMCPQMLGRCSDLGVAKDLHHDSEGDAFSQHK